MPDATNNSYVTSICLTENVLDMSVWCHAKTIASIIVKNCVAWEVINHLHEEFIPTHACACACACPLPWVPTGPSFEVQQTAVIDP